MMSGQFTAIFIFIVSKIIGKSNFLYICEGLEWRMNQISESFSPKRGPLEGKKENGAIRKQNGEWRNSLAMPK